MAPREPAKPMTKLQRERTLIKTFVQRTKSPVASNATIKKTIRSKNTIDKVVKAHEETVPATPSKSRTQLQLAADKRVAPSPSITKSAKKSTWKRRPKPAHSGVPVPEKLKKLLIEKKEIDSSH
ncbi:uncharacterized protein LOC120626550 [Pararge aegeria]|uniref:Jg5152 protein n=2 Tax=Pararge aegeria TaxID=116150 RepID=A0A8S4S4A8_9NEOP|nr:uncharacterized protein LOC120626550 [Pararge aegeria]CAH2244802.1 jg5152 [Pararge aegeria aegeria]